MLDAIIPSKDRAFQLRFLLESIKKNSTDLFDRIHIIYKSSNDLYEEGYKKLQEEKLFDNIEWQKEGDFVEDFLGAMTDYDSEYICGLVDDCVFYKKLPGNQELILDAFDDSIFCFSFRMGLNTTIQNYLDPNTKYNLKDYTYSSHFIKWNWKEWDSRLNYGYPISLDGHIFRRKELSELSTKYKFDYLRQWEGVLAGNLRRDETNQIGEFMASYKQNVLFSIPANCVQDPPLISGQIHRYDEEYLNELYLDNKVLDLDAMESTFQNVASCHNEIPFMCKDLIINV
tara:strand:+ start:118 stop:975 length:858 start_codon:yes stop_codon:yes gene_type:complete